MLTGPYFYSFNTKEKPGKIHGRAIRFETIELDADTFEGTQFNILCDKHPELRQFQLSALRQSVMSNIKA